MKVRTEEAVRQDFELATGTAREVFRQELVSVLGSCPRCGGNPVTGKGCSTCGRFTTNDRKLAWSLGKYKAVYWAGRVRVAEAR